MGSSSASIQLPDICAKIWKARLAYDSVLRTRLELEVERLPTGSLEETCHRAADARNLLEQLMLVGRTGLSSGEIVTYEFLEHDLNRLARVDTMWHDQFLVTPYSLYWGLVVYAQHVIGSYRVSSFTQLDRYRSLLADFSLMVKNALARTKDQAERGWRIPEPALDGVVETLTRVRSSINDALVPHGARLEAIPQSLRDVWVAAAETAVKNDIQPAFSAVIDFVGGTGYRAAAPESVGLCHLPGGNEAYLRQIEWHLGFQMSPEKIHQVGLEQVAMLSEQMQATRDQVGFRGTEAAFHASLRANSRAYMASPAEIETVYRSCIRRIEPVLPQFFSVLPKTPYRVMRVSPELEAGMSYGHYEPPMHAGQDGIYYYNGSGLDQRIQLSAAALMYHEILPGHHFHFSRQIENNDIPPIRREAWENSIFNEGWAEYASGLAGDMGMYDDPYDRYGRLVQERFSAQRLVTDTGLNAMGWELDRARDYMRATTLESATQINSETLRYSTDLPGQALAYRIGHLEFIRLRNSVVQRRGSSFDIRKFHEAILTQGALPMTVLESHLERSFPASPRGMEF